MKSAIKPIFEHLYLYLDALTANEYSTKLSVLMHSSIGQHTRHILEFFSCFLAQKHTQIVNYDLRERNILLETDPDFATETLKQIEAAIANLSVNQSILLQTLYQEQAVTSTIERELVYLLEHTIHHLAMVRIGIHAVAPTLDLPADFGVAKATVIAHQNSLTH